MKLRAISDLHITHPLNRAALEAMPEHPDDWLILAGDITNGSRWLESCFRLMKEKFHTVIWVPGNHELWSPPGDDGPRGAGLLEHLVAIARSCGVITPEDPWPVFPHASGDVIIAPLFLLYDYSFRPAAVAADRVVAWAREDGTVCSDEYYLHPDPFADRASWCAKRVADTLERLESLPAGASTVLVNHFPLEEEHAGIPRYPRFSPWCGTTATRGWHRRFNARAVVYGHLHMRSTTWLDDVPFQEVSLGNPSQWRQELGIGAYLHEVVVTPERGTAP